MYLTHCCCWTFYSLFYDVLLGVDFESLSSSEVSTGLYIKAFMEVCTVWKVSKYGVISGLYFPVFGMALFTQCYNLIPISSFRNKRQIVLNILLGTRLWNLKMFPWNYPCWDFSKQCSKSVSYSFQKMNWDINECSLEGVENFSKSYFWYLCDIFPFKRTH